LTCKSYKKILKQIAENATKKKKFLKHNKPPKRNCGLGRRKCLRCGKFGAHIKKYGLGLCRQCFREIAPELGFKKYGHEV
jgi:ribosomal protein S14